MLRIKRPLYEQMINHLEAVYPLEGCGILAGREGKVTAVYPIANILQSPTAFEMDPAAQIQTMLALEEAGDDFLAVFHSHPQGPAVPSPTDIAQAYYPEQLQLIVSFQERHHPTCRTFTIQAGVVREVGIQIE